MHMMRTSLKLELKEPFYKILDRKFGEYTNGRTSAWQSYCMGQFLPVISSLLPASMLESKCGCMNLTRINERHGWLCIDQKVLLVISTAPRMSVSSSCCGYIAVQERERGSCKRTYLVYEDLKAVFIMSTYSKQDRLLIKKYQYLLIYPLSPSTV